MGVFYKLFQFKADLAAIMKRYCCHGNVSYKFILTTIRLLTCQTAFDVLPAGDLRRAELMILARHISFGGGKITFSPAGGAAASKISILL